jgi:hypothetical protein
MMNKKVKETGESKGKNAVLYRVGGLGPETISQFKTG